MDVDTCVKVGLTWPGTYCRAQVKSEESAVLCKLRGVKRHERRIRAVLGCTFPLLTSDYLGNTGVTVTCEALWRTGYKDLD